MESGKHGMRSFQCTVLLWFAAVCISAIWTVNETVRLTITVLLLCAWLQLAKCALGLLRLEKLGARFSAPSVDDFLLFRNQHSGAVRFMYISYHKCQLVGGPHWDGIWMPVELLGEGTTSGCIECLLTAWAYHHTCSCRPVCAHQVPITINWHLCCLSAATQASALTTSTPPSA